MTSVPEPPLGPLKLSTPKEDFLFENKNYCLYQNIIEQDFDIVIERYKVLKSTNEDPCTGSTTKEVRPSGYDYMSTLEWEDGKIIDIALDSSMVFIEYISIYGVTIINNKTVFDSTFVCSRKDPKIRGLGLKLRKDTIVDLINKYKESADLVYFTLVPASNALKDYWLKLCDGLKKCYYKDSENKIYIGISPAAIEKEYSTLFIGKDGVVTNFIPQVLKEVVVEDGYKFMMEQTGFLYKFKWNDFKATFSILKNTLESDMNKTPEQKKFLDWLKTFLETNYRGDIKLI